MPSHPWPTNAGLASRLLGSRPQKLFRCRPLLFTSPSGAHLLPLTSLRLPPSRIRCRPFDNTTSPSPVYGSKYSTGHTCLSICFFINCFLKLFSQLLFINFTSLLVPSRSAPSSSPPAVRDQFLRIFQVIDHRFHLFLCYNFISYGKMLSVSF